MMQIPLSLRPGVLKMCKKCAKPHLQENFDSSRYLGDWYELFRSKSIRFEKGHNIIARYGADPAHPDRITVSNQQTLDNGKTDGISGYAKKRSVDGLASDLTVRFNWLIRGRYMVVETDYDTYSIVFSQRCVFWGLIQKKYCWILGRKPELGADEELISKLFAIINEQTGMTRDEFIQTEHKPIEQ